MTETERRLANRHALWRQAFEGIELHGKDVLDAGIGEGHLTGFLAERDPARLVAITCVPDEVPPAKARIGPRADQVEFGIADLTAMPEVPSASFDVVAADFLIAAVAAYSPYREVDCLKELHRVLRPGGRIIVTGWQASPPRRSPTEVLVCRLSKLRDGIHHLNGEEPFREHPRFWVEQRLTDLGMPPERHCDVADVHFDFTWFCRSVHKALDRMPSDELKHALEVRVDRLEAELRADPAFRSGFEFGALYAVVACKLQGAHLLMP